MGGGRAGRGVPMWIGGRGDPKVNNLKQVRGGGIWPVADQWNLGYWSVVCEQADRQNLKHYLPHSIAGCNETIA